MTLIAVQEWEMPSPQYAQPDDVTKLIRERVEYIRQRMIETNRLPPSPLVMNPRLEKLLREHYTGTTITVTQEDGGPVVMKKVDYTILEDE